MPFDYPATFPETEAKELLGSLTSPVKPAPAALLHDSWAVAGYVMGQAMPVGSGVPAFSMPPSGLKKLKSGMPEHDYAVSQLKAAVAQADNLSFATAGTIDWQAILALAFSFINQLMPLL